MTPEELEKIKRLCESSGVATVNLHKRIDDFEQRVVEKVYARMEENLKKLGEDLNNQIKECFEKIKDRK